MKYIFFGTPNFAAIILKRMIKKGLIPVMVVCNPDRPVGRKKIVTPPPVKTMAQKNKIDIWQPERLEIKNWKSKVKKFKEIDFAIVVSYSKLIPAEILNVLPDKFVGIHPSLLPKYRGASPIQSMILSGEEKIGASVFLIDEKMDHGPILAFEKYTFQKTKLAKIVFSELHDNLAELGANILIKTLPNFIVGKTKPILQDHGKATFTKKIKTENAFICFEELEEAEKVGGEIALEIDRKIRALNPEPGVWTKKEQINLCPITSKAKRKEKRIKLLEAEILDDGRLKLKKIQFEGKNPQELN